MQDRGETRPFLTHLILSHYDLVRKVRLVVFPLRQRRRLKSKYRRGIAADAYRDLAGREAGRVLWEIGGLRIRSRLERWIGLSERRALVTR